MKSHKILAVDIGTTAMKMGLYEATDSGLIEKANFSENYSIRTYNNGMFSDIDQNKWTSTFVAGCKALSGELSKVGVIALSGTTPGLSAMDKNGDSLYPAILMLDSRSQKQAKKIIDRIGLDELLNKTGNMPVAGGCSLASILWIKENHQEIYKETACFGHSNTYLAKWLTGQFAIDPSSASLTALYNTVENDLQWNEPIASEFGISLDQLPSLMNAWQSPGNVTPQMAKMLGLKKEPAVIIGGNDAVLAAYSAGINKPGDIINVNGTCEISLVCLPECLPSTSYNVRVHVEPNKWLTLYVMNAGGKAYEWFKNLFCSELSQEAYFNQFIPRALDKWIGKDITVEYIPYLMGSRYSLEPLKAEFKGLTHNTTREEILAAITFGLCKYQTIHLAEISASIPLSSTIHVTGGALNDEIIRAKQEWMWSANYKHVKQSSLVGAAMLAQKFLTGQELIPDFKTI